MYINVVVLQHFAVLKESMWSSRQALRLWSTVGLVHVSQGMKDEIGADGIRNNIELFGNVAFWPFLMGDLRIAM